jgi:hypothetical protein
MWNDPEKLAAMEALKDEPAPADKALSERLLDVLKKRAETSADPERLVYARVMAALAPIFVEMRELKRQDTNESRAKAISMTFGMLDGLGFGIATVLTYVPPMHYDTALQSLFASAKRQGFDVEFLEVPKS